MKEFKTIEEQLDILKSKGMQIDINDEEAANILICGNYYNIINGYKDLFLNKDEEQETFYEGTTFSEVYALYEFDRQIRTIIFEAILRVENLLRSLISYSFSKKYGNNNYLKIENFDNLPANSKESNKIKQISHIQGLISELHGVISKAVGKKDYITHYIMTYGFVPLWVLVNDMSLGQLSKFYSLMKQPERIEVAKHWDDLLHNDLESYIKVLAHFRNLCAHDDRVYNSKTSVLIPNTIYHSNLNILQNENGNYLNGKKDFFSLLITFKVLLSPKEFNTIFNKVNGRIESLSTKINSISIQKIKDSMGLPQNWKLIK